VAGAVTYPGIVSLVFSPPLWGNRQIRASVPVKSKPAAVLAAASAARISASKFRGFDASCAAAVIPLKPANSAARAAMIVNCVLMGPPCSTLGFLLALPALRYARALR
jgi:hypothetical protein